MIWKYDLAGGIQEISELPALNNRIIAVDSETSGLNVWQDKMRCVQVVDGDVAYVLEDATPVLPYLTDTNYLKVFHNGQFDMSWIKHRYGVMPVRCVDTMLAERILTMGLGSGAGLQDVAMKYCGEFLAKDVRATFIGYEGPLTPQQIEYAAKDTMYLPKVWEKQHAQLIEAGMVPTAQLEFALLPVLVEMYLNGVGFSRERWSEVRVANAELRDQKFAELLEFFPHVKRGTDLLGGIFTDFNPASSDQLTYALNKIGIKVEEVSERTLKQYLRDHRKHPFFLQLFTALMSWRKASSLANLDLESHINPFDNRIHGDFNQLGARTGRMSMSAPNLQNQQSTDLLRSCFIAMYGNKLADLDLSQIELTVMAELSRDPNMMKAVLDGEDLHTAAARIIFGTDNPTKEQRQIAKSCNFAAIFGSGPNTFSITSGLPFEEAQKYLQLYFEKYPSVIRFGKSEIRKSLQRGYTETVGGRRRYIDDMAAARAGKMDSMLKNNPVQGTAAEIMKEAMIRVYGLAPAYGAKLLLQVHDELVCEVPSETAQEFGEKARQAMSEAGAKYLKILPVRASLTVADCWKK